MAIRSASTSTTNAVRTPRYSSAQREPPETACSLLRLLLEAVSPLAARFGPPHLPAPNNANDDARGAVAAARRCCLNKLLRLILEI
ncbi:hypothetical protein BJ912DRAFT_1058426 [Pholiota molesta]|nr:hypothetical protein BJ912DRAFT_1058426 [Pholiota molesta]